MTAPSFPRPGDTIAEKYVLEDVLGHGGMGVVFKATHVALPTTYAIKLLLSSHAPPTRASPMSRFEREARAAASLKSEHSVRVTDYGKLPGGNPYLVMEYLEGPNLHQELEKRGRLPVSDAAYYVLQACEALAEAHAQGILHRDLKPANLVLTQRASAPVIKVVDFGLSMMREGEGKLTHTHEVNGTPYYMSPEQYTDFHDVDARTDVWAMGVTLYELLTARLPFEGAHAMMIMRKICHDPPLPPRTHRPDLPPGLDQVILRCLEKDLARRVQNVAELARALLEFVTEPRAAQRAELLVETIERTLGLPGAPAPNATERPTKRTPHHEVPPAPAAPELSAQGPLPAEPPERSLPTGDTEAPPQERNGIQRTTARRIVAIVLALALALLVSGLMLSQPRDPPSTISLPSDPPQVTTSASAPPPTPSQVTVPTSSSPSTSSQVKASTSSPPITPLQSTASTSSRTGPPPKVPPCTPNGSKCTSSKQCCSLWCTAAGCAPNPN